MKVIIGLGNPGPQYRWTRHNVGFQVLDALAESLGASFSKEKHQGLMAEASSGGARLLLIKPLTFMNRSGDCAAPAVYNKIQGPEDLLVITDDVNLPLGRLRIRAGGSAGGHNGLKSLIERLGTNAFPRIRLGVGDERASGDLADHVLSRFLPVEKPKVEEMIGRAVDAALVWVQHGVTRAMNEYNADKGEPGANEPPQ